MFYELVVQIQSRHVFHEKSNVIIPVIIVLIKHTCKYVPVRPIT